METRKQVDNSVNSKVLAAMVALTLLASGSAWAGGFSLYEQGAKAMGLGGAFAAQADDPSALFYNVGGLAFVEERAIAAGVTLVQSYDEEFTGLPPFPGAGATGRLNSLAEPVPHVYWVQPTQRSWKFGLAAYAPFGLQTDWEDPDNFPGRFINTKASMQTFDLSANLGRMLTPRLGVGFGAIARFSSVEFQRRVPFANPLGGPPLEIAAADLESDLEQAFGWQAGLLFKANESFSWGLSYRSAVTVDYSGDARFTQIPTGNAQLDDLLRATFPFGADLGVETGIEFPAMATVAVAGALSRNTLLELDVNWAGWSSFDTLAIRFVDNPAFDIVRPENWEDVYTYRLGLRWRRPSGSEWRFGFVTDESPQPTASVSPLLPDGDRNGYSIGWGRRGDRVSVDLSIMALDFETRVNDRSVDGFNGAYAQSGLLTSATFGF